MGVTVEFLIDRCVAQAEIRAQVDDPQAAVEQSAGDFRSHAVREGEEGRLRAGCGDGVWIGFDEGEIGARGLAEARKHVA